MYRCQLSAVNVGESSGVVCQGPSCIDVIHMLNNDDDDDDHSNGTSIACWLMAR